MGGPWFTVQTDAAQWRRLGSLWLSNGESDGKAYLEYRVGFERFKDATD